MVVALLLVASLPAMGATGGVGGAADHDERSGVADLGPLQNVESEGIEPVPDADDARIDDALRRAEGRTEMVVRFDDADVPATADREGAVGAMRKHAEISQADAVRWAEASEHVEVRNTFWIFNGVLLEVDADEVSAEEVAEATGADRVHANFELTAAGGPANDSGTESTAPTASANGTNVSGDDVTYGLDMINATEVWDEHGTQGEGATVAVLDTGVDASHPDIDLYTDDPDDPTYPGGWAEFDSDGEIVEGSEPHDDSGHGTHVSGTVAGAEEPNDSDIPSFGVAPGADLLHGMVIPGGGGSFTQVAAGMEWAVDDTDADVVSMSLGATGYSSEMVEPSENARDAGVVLVAAAGNDGHGASGSPGNVYPNFASGAVDADGDVASFSSGETVTTASAYPDAPDYWPDEYVVPNAAAPGVDIVSAVPGGGYDGTYSGTSMSAPHHAGAFALMVSASGGDVDAETLREAMEDTAWKPDDWDEPEGEYDERYGMGIVDVAAATDQVALDSGVNGTVTDADGEAIEGATVAVDETGSEVTTDENGSYTVLAQPGTYTLTASAFGYESADATVEVPDNETFVEQEFELPDGVGAELVDGQPEGIEGGDAFDVTFDVANLDTYAVERADGYDGDLSLALDGESIEEGESVDVGGATGEVTLTVETEADTAGDLELEHAFAGANDSEAIVTGPTSVFEEFTPVAVVDDGGYGDDVVDRLDGRVPPSYDLSVVDGAEAVDAAANGEYEAYVVQDIDESHVDAFAANTTDPDTGVVWLDQWGSYSDAIPARSSVLGNPESTDDSFTSPNPSLEIASDHPIFEDVGDVGDTVAIHDATFADHSWFDGYDGDVVGLIQAGGVTDGGGVGVDERERTVLLSTFGSSNYVDSGDFSSEADAVLANAVAWSAEQPPVSLDEDQPTRADPDTTLGAAFSVDELEKVSVDLADESTADRDDLDLYVDGSVNAWDEWRAYDPPRSSDDFTIEVDSTDETVGSVVLETTFSFADEDDVTITTGPTAVYEAPLSVPGDVETIEEAVDLAPEGAEIVVDDGTYEEAVTVDTPNLTITAADGASPTVVAPENDSDAAVTVAADGTTVSGVDVDGNGDAAGLVVDGASDASVADVEAANATTGVAVEGGSHVDLADVGASGAETGVAVTDAANVSVTGADAADVGTGVLVADAEAVAVEAASVADADEGVVVDGSDGVDVANASVADAATGIAATDSAVGEITTAEVADVGDGVVIDGGSVDAVTGNDVSDAETGVSVVGGADVASLADNEVADAATGLAVSGQWTSVDATTNVVAADVGVAASDVSTDAVSVRFNDLEATETAVAYEGDGTFDARHNWFGERGPAASGGVSGDVVYEPFLTETPDAVDENTTEIAVDVDLEAGETYTVGVPGTTDQTVGDVFGDDFEGATYGYDSADDKWNALNRNHDLSSLSAVLVVAEDDGTAVLDFQIDEATTVPGAEDLNQGWNLVSPTAYTAAEDGFGNDNSPATVAPAHAHGDGHLGESAAVAGGEYDPETDVNPFGGYWVHVESADDEYQYPVDLQANPTTADLYESLGLTPDESDDGPTLPDEVTVAVVDETDYHEGAIEGALADTLGDGYAVDTVTADDLLDSMDEYDVFVVQRLGSDALAEDFLDALGPDQSTVYLDSYQGATSEAYADGVYRLNAVEGDPADRDAEATATDGEPVTIDIHEDHPIFEDVGGAGDTVEVYAGSTTWGAWFDDYDGTVLADGDWSSGEDGTHEGPSIAVNEADNEVLNTAIARDYFTDEPEFTEAGNRLLANSVEHAADLAFGVAGAEAAATTAGSVDATGATTPAVSALG